MVGVQINQRMEIENAIDGFLPNTKRYFPCHNTIFSLSHLWHMLTGVHSFNLTAEEI